MFLPNIYATFYHRKTSIINKIYGKFAFTIESIPFAFLNVNDVLRVEILGKFFRHLQKYHILRLSIDVEQIKQTVSPKNN